MDDEEKEPTFLDIDIAELKERLDLPEDTNAALVELGHRFEAINRRFGELLIYMNRVDERVQSLAGERQITTKIHQHIGNDGVTELSRSRPEVPDLADIRNPQNLQEEEPSRALKMVVSQ